MTPDPNSLESAMRGTIRGMAARIAILEDRLTFWIVYGTGMTVIAVAILVLAYRR